MIPIFFNLNAEKTLFNIAEFGIAFLMFTIGLELSIHKLKRMKKEVLVYGSLQVFISITIFSSISYYCNFVLTCR